MGEYITEQETFWAEEFGDEYLLRSNDAKIVCANTRLFCNIFRYTKNIRSIIELGANIGLNLLAINNLLSDVELSAVEINKKAVEELKKIDAVTVYHQSILTFVPDYQRDFVFTKGVLIHINPDMLYKVYDLLYKLSQRYICIAEYYNRTPISAEYRGHKNKLFKRDFAGEILERFDDVSLTSYGFTYHRDSNYDYDDLNWFLMEKR
jgi:pseudaminic acid biosynthesis-associated methylase